VPQSLQQQSHHCGIETFDLHDDFAQITKQQQSHHCGIETIANTKSKRRLVKQQSHHCGIETVGLVLGIARRSGSNRTIVGLKRLAW